MKGGCLRGAYSLKEREHNVAEVCQPLEGESNSIIRSVGCRVSQVCNEVMNPVRLPVSHKVR